MSIHSLRVRNFQSLHDIQLDLLPFTVIVGPSSSGKSALARAIRTLVSNRRGTDWITTGERTASITAVTDAGTVTLTRSRTSSSPDNSYTITSGDDTRTYAKLGGDTPDDVSRFLGIPSGTSDEPPINFAGQFDKPFLLADSAAAVARTLGALTNVSVIFDGARESNRRKLATTALLKTRAADLDAVKARVPEFQSLKAQGEALTEAEALILTAQDQQRQIARLTDALYVLETLEPSIALLQARADRVLPDDSGILRAQEAHRSFQQALARVSTLSQAQRAAQAVFDQADADLSAAEERYAAVIEKSTSDVRTYVEEHLDPMMIQPHDTGKYVEFNHVVSIFLQFLAQRSGRG